MKIKFFHFLLDKNKCQINKIEMTARYDDKTDLNVNVAENVKKTLLPHKNILNPLIIIVSIENYTIKIKMYYHHVKINI